MAGKEGKNRKIHFHGYEVDGDVGISGEENSIYKLKRNSEEGDSEDQVTGKSIPNIEYYSPNTQYQCFLWNSRKSSALGLYQVPLRYTKKLILALLFIYAG